MFAEDCVVADLQPSLRDCLFQARLGQLFG
jgi:hypothetical protein